ncbi:MAG: NFACT family protein, partial [Desulfonatronovibrionaceae bacterium]
MEANFFRFAAEELFQKIKGLRIEKVFQPDSRVWTFALGAAGNLIFFCRPKGGGFFLSEDKPTNPLNPCPGLMWLRKRIKNRRITGYLNLWPYRKTALALSGTREFLVLDITKAPYLAQDLPENHENPVWPDIEQVLEQADIWKDYPQLTPLLRTTLKSMDRKAASGMLDELSRGCVQDFYVVQDAKGNREPACFQPVNRTRVHEFSSALEAARFWGTDQAWKMAVQWGEREKKQSRALKRVRRNLARLRKDRDRLKQMALEADQAELIRQNLYQLDSQHRAFSITLEDLQGQQHTIELDPALDLTGNMQKFFRRAAKARRGLDFTEKREQELLSQLHDLQNQAGQHEQQENLTCSVQKRPQAARGR